MGVQPFISFMTVHSHGSPVPVFSNNNFCELGGTDPSHREMTQTYSLQNFSFLSNCTIPTFDLEFIS